jgi:2-polyprenyl-3-methyl-5-hydroxy-6-metoxy-1,4-benzoquinol methylase
MVPTVSYRQVTLAACPFCHSHRWRRLLEAPNRLTRLQGVFVLSRCNDCGLAFQNPRVRPEDIGHFYTEELNYYQPAPALTPRSWRERLTQAIARHTLSNHFSYHQLARPRGWIQALTWPWRRLYRIALVPEYVPGGSVLELGSAHGARLEELRTYGWKVTGVEMDSSSAAYARRERGLDVREGTVEDITFAPASFDVIIMSMVLEHISDPFSELPRITQWLKPGGQLLISIPYVDGIEFRLFGRHAYGLQLPFHYTFFTRSILETFLIQLGYRDVIFSFQAVDRDFVASAQFRFADEPRWWWYLLGYSAILRRWCIGPLVHLLSLFSLTSRVSVSARKVPL